MNLEAAENPLLGVSEEEDFAQPGVEQVFEGGGACADFHLLARLDVLQLPAEVAQRLRRRRKSFGQGLAVRDEAHVRRVVEKLERFLGTPSQLGRGARFIPVREHPFLLL